MNRLLISAAHKSSGKTTVSIGLCAAIRERGLRVQPFKKGPDYIDPMWLGKAAGHDCYNLDFYLSPDEEILEDFICRSAGADLALIEGNKGLYDGMALDGSNSNAALAKLLSTPVVLVVNTQGITRGIAPLLLGYQGFDAMVNIAGVILNKVGGSRHEEKLRAAVEYYTDIPVLGALPRDAALTIDERHLGLIPSNESEQAQALIETCGLQVESSVDVQRILDIQCVPLPLAHAPAPTITRSSDRPLRIGIARDAAFGFYYPADLEAMEAGGAKLVPIDMLTDTTLPAVDGLFIGGGFPETHMAALQQNSSMRQSVKQAIESGLPVYAECGGLMYLSRSISWQGQKAEMAGVIPGDVVMHERPVGRGYTRLAETSAHPWRLGDQQSALLEFPAHEFHHSSLENLQNNPTYAYKVLRGSGINGENDGYVYKNLLASYVHLRQVAGNQWVDRFLDFVRACQTN